MGTSFQLFPFVNFFRILFILQNSDILNLNLPLNFEMNSSDKTDNAQHAMQIVGESGHKFN